MCSIHDIYYAYCYTVHIIQGYEVQSLSTKSKLTKSDVTDTDTVSVLSLTHPVHNFTFKNHDTFNHKLNL